MERKSHDFNLGKIICVLLMGNIGSWKTKEDNLFIRINLIYIHVFKIILG